MVSMDSNDDDLETPSAALLLLLPPGHRGPLRLGTAAKQCPTGSATSQLVLLHAVNGDLRWVGRLSGFPPPSQPRDLRPAEPPRRE